MTTQNMISKRGGVVLHELVRALASIIDDMPDRLKAALVVMWLMTAIFFALGKLIEIVGRYVQAP